MSLTLVIEILQVTANIDADVLHFHVLQTSKLVHVFQQTVILASSWTFEDMERICMGRSKTEGLLGKCEEDKDNFPVCAGKRWENKDVCNMWKDLLVLLAGRRPSFQTYLCTTHWYQALQAPQPPLLSPHHHLNTSIRSKMNTVCQSSLNAKCNLSGKNNKDKYKYKTTDFNNHANCHQRVIACYVSISKLRKLEGNITHCLCQAFWELPPGFRPQPPGFLHDCWCLPPGSEPLNAPLVPWRCCP